MRCYRERKRERDAIKHSKIVDLPPECGDLGGQAKGQRSKVKDQISVHACCRHSDVFGHLEKWPTPPTISPSMFRHHFWCFPFLYIKNTKHNSEKNSVGCPIFLLFHFSKTVFFLFIFISAFVFCLFVFFPFSPPVTYILTKYTIFYNWTRLKDNIWFVQSDTRPAYPISN